MSSCQPLHCPISSLHFARARGAKAIQAAEQQESNCSCQRFHLHIETLRNELAPAFNDLFNASLRLNTGPVCGYDLSPLLNSLFTNDYVFHHSSVKCVKFADDTTLEGQVSNSGDSEYRHEINRAVSRRDNNNLQLNAGDDR